MKKTGNLCVLLLMGCFFLIGSAFDAVADDIGVQASLSNDFVSVGDNVELHVEVKAEHAQHIERPALPHVSGVRFTSTTPEATTRYRVEGGRAVIVQRFTYQLQGVEEGLVAIPSMSVNIDGETYYSNELDIRVTGGGQAPPPRERRPEMFLQKELSDDQPVRGQQITADIVVYFRDYININNYQVTQGWSSEGFWHEDMSDEHQARAETVFLDGLRYRRAVLMRHAIFPTRAETLRMQPYKISINVRARPPDGQSEMFGRGGTRDVDLATETMQLEVTPLPEPDEGQFINAVGELTIDRYLESDRLQIGESTELITEISGSGNLALLNRPDFNIPGAFDSFQPRENIDLDQSGARMTGTSQFRDVLIARRVGTFTIPEDTIAVYNNLTRSYESVILPELDITVERNPSAQIGSGSTGGFRVTPINTVTNWLTPEDRILAGQWWFWVGLITPFFIIIGSHQYYQYMKKVLGDASLQRKSGAFKNARKMLDQAKKEARLGNTKEVYALIYRTILTYITDKLDTRKAGYTEQQIIDLIKPYVSDERRIDKLEFLLKRCSEIRYAQQTEPEFADEDIDKTHGLIAYFDSKIK